jgi:hypothetical protein
VVRIRIEGRDLPGRECAAAPGFPGYPNVHVGVQRRARPGELLDLQPADAPSVTWTFDAAVHDGDVRGPYIQGGPDGRFVYLSWGAVTDGRFAMFRRAKLRLADLDPSILAEAERSGILVARLGLTDAKGQPICATVKPPLVRWSAECPAGRALLD